MEIDDTVNELHVLILLAALTPPPSQPLPTLADLHRFPDHTYAHEAWQFAYKYDTYLHRRWELESCYQNELDAQLEEARALRHYWNLLDSATNPESWRHNQIEALTELRDRLGPIAWGNGQMPPPVPWWTFEDVTDTQHGIDRRWLCLILSIQ